MATSFVLPDEDTWYHISPHNLEPGTELAPSGGESPFGSETAQFKDHANHVWMHNDPWAVWSTRSEMAGYRWPLHIYEVKPSQTPQKRPEGHVAPKAKVIRRIDPLQEWADNPEVFRAFGG